MVGDGGVILPVWHHIGREEVIQRSPLLGNLVAVSTDRGIAAVVDELIRATEPPSSLTPPASASGPDPYAFNGQALLEQHGMSNFVLWRVTLHLQSLSTYTLAELYRLAQDHLQTRQTWFGVWIPVPDILAESNRTSPDADTLLYKSGDEYPQYRNLFGYKLAVIQPRTMVCSSIELTNAPDMIVDTTPLISDLLHLLIFLCRVHREEPLQPDVTVDVNAVVAAKASHQPRNDSFVAQNLISKYQLVPGRATMQFGCFDRPSYSRLLTKILGLFRNEQQNQVPFLPLDERRLGQWLDENASS